MIGSQGTRKGRAARTSWERRTQLGKRGDCIVIAWLSVGLGCVILECTYVGIYTFGDFPADGHGRQRVATSTRRRGPNRGEVGGGQGTSRRDGARRSGQFSCVAETMSTVSRR